MVVHSITMVNEHALAGGDTMRNTSHPIDILTRVQYTRSASLNGTHVGS